MELIGVALRDATQALQSLRKMCDLLSLQTESLSPAERGSCGSGPATLQFRDVTFSYTTARALADISFDVPAGSLTAIVGASGCGKSTLARLLLRLYETDRGEILLDGTRITDLPLSALRQAVVIVSQDAPLFHDSVEFNITVGAHRYTREDLIGAAKRAGIHETIMAMPEGYATVLGDRGFMPSGGERQRIAIARALLRQPRVLVLDEPTASLDAHTEAMILADVQRNRLRVTTLLIAHRLSSVVHADEIVVLSDGHLIERGVHPALLRARGAYAAMWHAQHTSAPAAAG
jgi:ABC-type multidrug transport system fused ATPase/permease subunit